MIARSTLGGIEERVTFSLPCPRQQRLVGSFVPRLKSHLLGPALPQYRGRHFFPMTPTTTLGLTFSRELFPTRISSASPIAAREIGDHRQEDLQPTVAPGSQDSPQLSFEERADTHRETYRAQAKSRIALRLKAVEVQLVATKIKRPDGCAVVAARLSEQLIDLVLLVLGRRIGSSLRIEEL
jgi:hypothetical protein